MEKTLLEVKGLSKDFLLHILNDKHIEALEDINFELKEGEIVGLIGKSGSGKSTLMKCVYRTYLASKGEINYTDNNGKTINLVEATDNEVLALRKKEITYCSQFLSVIPRVPAVDVVADGLLQREDNPEAQQIAKEILFKMGLPESLWDAYPSTFSGGEQQRINVARAIISEPRFLLIDEPTASLDQKTKDVVIDMVLELKKRGTSVLVISHDQYTLDKMCDRLVELKHGKIIEPKIQELA